MKCGRPYSVCWFLPLLLKDLSAHCLLHCFTNGKRLAFNIFQVRIKIGLYLCFMCMLIEFRMDYPFVMRSIASHPLTPSPSSHLHPLRSRARSRTNLWIIAAHLRGNTEAHNPPEGVCPAPVLGSIQTQASAKTLTLVTFLFWLENVSVFGFNQNCS